MIIHVPLHAIDDNPFQRRQDYGDVAGLAADISARGLLQKPIGRLLDSDGVVIMPHNVPQYSITDLFTIRFCRVQIAFGHRRLRAFRHLAETAAGWNTMPIDVELLDDDAMLDAVWSENQHRSDINPIEQAELLAEKLERVRAAGGNQQTLAADWGLDRSTIANKLRLLDLPADVQAAVRDRKLSERQAQALLPVVEMQNKLNGDTGVKWDQGKKPEFYGPPIAPDAFLAHAVANPDKMTSDTIRDYARRAVDHAGRPLADDLAKFEAGQGEAIIQPTCAGCRYRHNQHCLRPACRDAKWELFKQQIPQLAAGHTGLPWCDDPAAFTLGRDDARQLRARYDEGRRDNLVVGWTDAGYKDTWFTGRQGDYRNYDSIRADWRNGLLLGRLPQTDAEDLADESEQPPTGDWFRIRNEAQARHVERVKEALTAALDRLLDDRAEHLRPLLYLLGRTSYGYSYRPEQPVTEALHQLVENMNHFTYHPYDSWGDLFQAIGLDPALADPTDPADLLREQAAGALIEWGRNRGYGPRVISPIAVALGQAINAFESAGITPGDDDAELGELARWLPIAYADAGAAINGRTVVED